ncbi:alanine/ornithine racemase family PLP-dependent enzyme [Erysipelotrichaceae bacterium OttesenSCG-928-M19]|nr:alanine/ornithine racemase family PLP-dependent enzyme [Erysipelotrichaceae bacterium OttesenSCG-928-M19]
MKSPYLEIDLSKIINNAIKLQEMLSDKQINITFITKGVLANLDIIKAVQKAGIKYFGDSRIDNIKKVKLNLPNINYTLIRIPRLSELDDVVEYCDYSLQSELDIIKELDKRAQEKNKIHNIILMVDVGDLREGVLVADVLPTIKEILKLDNIKLSGIGTNVGCYRSIMPSVENTQILVDLKHKIKDECYYEIEMISGGSTCTTRLFFNNQLNPEINFLRIGEAILLGEDSTNDIKINGFEDDAFILSAEIVELKNKPSLPIGQKGKDAFGNENEYIDYGAIDRAILAIGRQDVIIEALEPLDDQIKILGGSSDHMILDVTKSSTTYNLGDCISFRCCYSAMLTSMASPYVTKIFK